MVNTFNKILQILPKGFKLKFSVLFLLMLIGTFLDVIGIGLIPVFISCLSHPEILLQNSHARPILKLLHVTNGQDLLFTGAITIILVFLIKGLYTIVLEYIKSKFVYRCFQLVSGKLFKAYMFSPYVFHLNKNSAKLIRNVTTHTYELANNLMVPFLIVLTQIITVIGIFLLLIFVEPVITLFTFFTLGLCAAVFLYLIRNSLKTYGDITSYQYSKMFQAVNEGLGGFKEATVMNRKWFFVNRFNLYVSNLKKAQIFVSTSNQATKPIVEFIAVAGMMSIAFVMTLQGRPISAVMPILTLFAAAAFKLMPAVAQIMSQLGQVKYYGYALDAVHKDILELDLKEERDQNSKANNDKLGFNDKIQINKVSYNYPNTKAVALDDVSLQIERGSAIAFVGASGAGKSTIVDLILGLLQPQQGQILVDGKDITTDMTAWQNNVGYIPQHIYLSDDSIRNNIAFGIPTDEISDDKILAAINAAQLDEYILSLEDGINTMVGERGVRLSGGQRQRIGIARAIYHNPELLIMDEATSALDNITERQVIEAIEALKGKRTIIMIAHRLTTVMNCDKLYFMKGGKIIKEGTYDELLNESSNFRKMALGK
ncbi:MAG: ABC transporter ATP-binding protein [Mucilaginibacter sp.]